MATRKSGDDDGGRYVKVTGPRRRRRGRRSVRPSAPTPSSAPPESAQTSAGEGQGASEPPDGIVDDLRRARPASNRPPPTPSRRGPGPLGMDAPHSESAPHAPREPHAQAASLGSRLNVIEINDLQPASDNTNGAVTEPPRADPELQRFSLGAEPPSIVVRGAVTIGGAPPHEPSAIPHATSLSVGPHAHAAAHASAAPATSTAHASAAPSASAAPHRVRPSAHPAALSPDEPLPEAWQTPGLLPTHDSVGPLPTGDAPHDGEPLMGPSPELDAAVAQPAVQEVELPWEQGIATRQSISSVLGARASLMPSPPPEPERLSLAWWIMIALLSVIILAAVLVAVREAWKEQSPIVPAAPTEEPAPTPVRPAPTPAPALEPSPPPAPSPPASAAAASEPRPSTPVPAKPLVRARKLPRPNAPVLAAPPGPPTNPAPPPSPAPDLPRNPYGSE